MHASRHQLLAAALAGAFILFNPTPLPASGFQTSYHSVSSFSRGLGGAGVSGDDLADIYYNPGSLSLLYPQRSVQVYGGLGSIDIDFENEGSSRTVGPFSFPSDGEIDGIDEPTPSFSLVYVPEPGALDNDVHFGIFIGNVYGNDNRYDSDWIGRYHAIKSRLVVIDVSPTISFEIADNTHLGLALSLQKSKAKLSQAQIMPDGFGGFDADGKNIVEGKDSSAAAIGIGLVHKAFYASGNATLGISFRSSPKHKLDGDLKIWSAAGDVKLDADAELNLPETVYLSARFDFNGNSDWSLYWTSRWTNWSRNRELRVDFANGLSSITPQDWEDTWLHGIGVSYNASDTITLRAGLTVDQTPIPDAERRTPRFPEGDRSWLSFGLSWKTSKNATWDFGYNYQVIDDADIDTTKSDLLPPTAPIGASDTLSGEYKDGTVRIFGAQFRYDF